MNPHELADESVQATPIIQAADGAIARGASSPAESPASPAENPVSKAELASNDSKNDDTKNG